MAKSGGHARGLEQGTPHVAHDPSHGGVPMSTMNSPGWNMAALPVKGADDIGAVGRYGP